jgi:hypothetical protein
MRTPHPFHPLFHQNVTAHSPNLSVPTHHGPRKNGLPSIDRTLRSSPISARALEGHCMPRTVPLPASGVVWKVHLPTRSPYSL